MEIKIIKNVLNQAQLTDKASDCLRTCQLFLYVSSDSVWYVNQIHTRAEEAQLVH